MSKEMRLSSVQISILSVLRVSCVNACLLPRMHTEGKREKSTLQNILVERAGNLGIYCKTLD